MATFGCEWRMAPMRRPGECPALRWNPGMYAVPARRPSEGPTTPEEEEALIAAEKMRGERGVYEGRTTVATLRGLPVVLVYAKR